jgi:hypothetical protein
MLWILGICAAWRLLTAAFVLSDHDYERHVRWSAFILDCAQAGALVYVAIMWSLR